MSQNWNKPVRHLSDMASNPNVGVRFPVDLLQQVDSAAAKLGKTRSEVVLDFVRAGLGMEPEDNDFALLARLEKNEEWLGSVRQRLDKLERSLLERASIPCESPQNIIIRRSSCPECGNPGRNKGVRNGKRRWYCSDHGCWTTLIEDQN